MPIIFNKGLFGLASLVAIFGLPSMFDRIKEMHKRFPYLGVKEAAVLVTISRVRNVKSGEVIVRQGDFNFFNFSVVDGLLRTYIEAPDGTEKTILFAREGMNAASHASLFHDKPATESIMALENSTLVVHDVRKFEAAANKHPNIQRMYVDSIKINMNEAIERLAYYTSMSPEDRYVHFRDTYPDLLQRVPQIYLASYLGITPVSLSRIRARLGKAGK